MRTRPTIVFLDQNHLVGMARAGPAAAATLAHLLAQQRAGEILLPLSPIHYFETWHRREWTSRHRLARVMADLSAYASLGQTETLVAAEVDNAFRRRVGLPTHPVPAIGWGARHAFSHPLGRIRLLDDLASDDGGPGQEAGPEFAALLDRIGPEAYEWFSLAGPATDFDQLDGFDAAPRHRLGTKHVADMEAQVAHLEATVPTGKWNACIRAEWILAMWEPFMQAAREVDLNPRLAVGEGPSSLDWLVNDVPTISTWCELEQKLLRDRNYKWTQHDLNDIFALSVAAAYADVIVTERHWAHHLRSTAVVRRRQVVVHSKVDAAKEHFVARQVEDGGYQRWP